MTCQEAQSLITEYVQDQLDTKTLESFLQHVNHCPDCLEELEVYYIVFTGIKRLDDDLNIAINYHEEFQNTLRESANQIKREHRNHIARRIAFAILTFMIMLISNFSLGGHEREDNLMYRTEGNSEFELSHFYFSNRKTELDVCVLRNIRMEIDYTSNNKYRNCAYQNLIDGARVRLRFQLKYPNY